MIFKSFVVAIYLTCGIAFTGNEGMPCYEEGPSMKAISAIVGWPVLMINHHYLGKCRVD